MNIYLNQQKEMENEITDLVQALELMRSLPELPCVERAHFSTVNKALFVTIPFSAKALLDLRRALGSEWKFGQATEYPDSDVSQMQRTYRKDGEKFRLIVCMSTTMAGATCRRVKVGEKTEPVYEIQCGVAA